jgi:hypothetical protein
MLTSQFERLAESLINRAHVVCHTPLQPYCLWHVVNLRRIESPFALGGFITRGALLEAVAICASTIDAPPARLAPRMPKLPFDTAKEIAKFRAYRADYFAPFRQGESENGKPSQLPYELALVARLMFWGHMTEAEAWMHPRGVMLAQALAEPAGFDPVLLTEEDEKIWERLYPDAR